MNNQGIDQACAAARDSIPRLWFALYQGGLAAGFDDRQAFALVTAYVLSQNPHGICPDGPAGPRPDAPE